MEKLSYLNGKPNVIGIYKQANEDFIVKEDLGYELDGEGEHVFVYVRKDGCNTLFVAEQLAKFAKISAKLVGYAGLKDRNAITEQWFGLHIPGKETPDFSQFQLSGCEILSVVRHKKKLRIGGLKGNFFSLVLRDIDKVEEVEERLQFILKNGVPNYFGEQRFGHDNHNLVQAALWAKGEITIKDRKKRSFYLSAARSAIFNDLVSTRITKQLFKTLLNGDILQLNDRGSWFIANEQELPELQQRVNQGELNITAVMVGDNAFNTLYDALAFEKNFIEENWLSFMPLFKQERIESARRSILLRPKQLVWQWLDNANLQLSFWLPAGSYATSVLRELIISK